MMLVCFEGDDKAELLKFNLQLREKHTFSETHFLMLSNLQMTPTLRLKGRFFLQFIYLQWVTQAKLFFFLSKTG